MTKLTLPATAAQLSAQFGGQCVNGADAVTIVNVATLADADTGSLSFFNNYKYRDQLTATTAAVVVMRERDRHMRTQPAIIVSDDPRGYIAQVLELLSGERTLPAGIHPSAVIDATAELGSDVRIGPGVIVGARVKLGDGCTLLAGAIVADGCQIGANCLLREGCVVGVDGFGFQRDEQGPRRLAHYGSVVIGANVEIGANSCIDRGAVDDTVIGAGTKIDNLVQVGHSVKIGENCIICGCTGIAGSARIGANCTFGGAVKIANHATIAEGVTLQGATTVISDIRTPNAVYGSAILHRPIDEVRLLRRKLVRMGKQ